MALFLCVKKKDCRVLINFVAPNARRRLMNERDLVGSAYKNGRSTERAVRTFETRIPKEKVRFNNTTNPKPYIRTFTVTF